MHSKWAGITGRFRELAMSRTDKGNLSLRWTIVWFFCLAPAILLFVHSSGIYPLVWEHIPLSSVRHDDSFAYSAFSRRLDLNHSHPPVAQLLENGVPLPGHGDDPFQDVRSEGLGRYSFWDQGVYFSTSDNSDPLTNGRQYEILAPVLIDSSVSRVFYLLALLATLAFAVRHRRLIIRRLAHPPFVLSALIFLAPFVAARVWIFVDYPLGGIRPDSGSYFQLVQVMDAGRLPDFSIRSPGYPLFMKLVFSFSDSITAVMVVQSILSACGGLYMLYAIHRFRRALSPWAAVGLAAYFTGAIALESDTDLLPESLYVGFILFSFASLILALTTKKALFFGFSSAGIGAVILTKPAGLFLVGMYLLVIAFALFNGYGARRVASFALPLPVMLLALSLYNYLLVGAFTPTGFGESQIAFATFTFWEQDSRYPPQINKAVESVQKIMSENLTNEDRHLLLSPVTFGNYQKFYGVFAKGFDYSALSAASAPWQGDYFAARDWIRVISMDSIKKHPDLYEKFVVAQLATYFLANIETQPDFVDSIRDRAQAIYVEKRFSKEKGDQFRTALAKEFAAPPLLPTIRITGTGEDGSVVMESHSPWRQLYVVLFTIRNRLFTSPLWILACFVVFALSLIRLVASRGRHTGAFILVAVILSVFSASMVVALVEEALTRYSYTMEWAYYLSVALAPSLFFSEVAARAGNADKPEARGEKLVLKTY